MNVSHGLYDDWLASLSSEDPTFGVIKGLGTSPLLYNNRNEWLDLLFTTNGSLQLSLSLCYPAFDTADLAIHASGNENRTEPTPIYDSGTTSFSYSKVRQQFGQLGGSLSDRGVLQLQNRTSWIPGSEDYYYYPHAPSPFVVYSSNMEGPGGIIACGEASPSPGFTAFMYNFTRELSSWKDVGSINVDPSIAALVQEILQQGGSIAFAMQSLVTVLTSLAYYDQLEQFNGLSTVAITNFITSTVPVSHRGFIAVVSVVLVHIILLAIVVTLFVVKTHISALGNSWQVVAQLQGDEVETVMEGTGLKPDNQVLKTLDTDLRRRFVGVGFGPDRRRVGIIPG
jgi:hypothetical protein